MKKCAPGAYMSRRGGEVVRIFENSGSNLLSIFFRYTLGGRRWRGTGKEWEVKKEGLGVGEEKHKRDG